MLYSHSKLSSNQNPHNPKSQKPNPIKKITTITRLFEIEKTKELFLWKKTKFDQENTPQILMGASSSRRLGCWRKISLETVQSWRISLSMSCTCFPAFTCLYSNSLLIMSSSTADSIVKNEKIPKPSNWINLKTTRTKLFQLSSFGLAGPVLVLVLPLVLLGTIKIFPFFVLETNLIGERTLFEMVWWVCFERREGGEWGWFFVY